MLESPKDFFLSTKDRFQISQDEDDAAELFFAIRNMLNNGLEVDWDDTLLKMESILKEKDFDARAELADTEGRLEERPDKIKPLTQLQRVRLHEDALANLANQRWAQRPPALGGKGTWLDDPERPNDMINIDPHLITAAGAAWRKKKLGSKAAKMTDLPQDPEHSYNIGVNSRDPDDPERRHGFLGPFKSLDDIDPSVWLTNRVQELYDKRRDKVDSGRGDYTYGDYLEVLIGRPDMSGDKRKYNPIQGLEFFSDSPGTSCSTFRFIDGILDPDNSDYGKKIDIANNNINTNMQANLGEGNRGIEDTFQYNARAVNSRDKPHGDLLPPAFTWTRKMDKNYNRWVNDNQDRWNTDMSEEDSNRLWRYWVQLQLDGLDDDMISSLLLDTNGYMHEDFDWNDIRKQPQFQEVRDTSINRCGMLPFMLGFWLGDPDERRLAIGEYYSYMKGNDPHHPINQSRNEQKVNAHYNLGDLEMHELIDDAIIEKSKWVEATCQNWEESQGGRGGGSVVPVFTGNTELVESLVSDILESQHKWVFSNTFYEERKKAKAAGEKVEELTGYDSLSDFDRTKEKSLKLRMQESGIPFTSKGIPEIPPEVKRDPALILDLLDSWVDRALPDKYKKSAKMRIRFSYINDLRGMMRSKTNSFLSNAAHYFWPLKHFIEGEGEYELHERPSSNGRSPVALYHSCLTPHHLAMAPQDGAEVWCQMELPLYKMITNSMLTIWDHGYAKVPEGGPNDDPDSEYQEWLEGVESCGIRGGISNLGWEVDLYLRNPEAVKSLTFLGPVYEKMWKEEAPPNDEQFVTTVLSLLFGEQLAEAHNREEMDRFALSVMDEENPSMQSSHSLFPARVAHGRDTWRPSALSATPAGPVHHQKAAIETAPYGRIPINSRIQRALISRLAPMTKAWFDKISAGIRDEYVACDKDKCKGIPKKRGGIAGCRDCNFSGKRLITIPDKLTESISEQVDARKGKMKQLADMGSLRTSLWRTGHYAGNKVSTGILKPSNLKNVVNVGATLQHGRISQKHGWDVASMGTTDGFMNRNRGNRLRRGAGARHVIGKKGVARTLANDHDTALVLEAFLQSGEATFTNSAGEKKHILEDPIGFLAKWGTDMGEYFSDKTHPFVPGMSLPSSLDIHEGDDWLDIDRYTDDTYLYPTGEMDDRGFHRIPMVEHPQSGSVGSPVGGAYTIRVPDVSQAVPYHTPLIGAQRVFSVYPHGNISERRYGDEDEQPEYSEGGIRPQIYGKSGVTQSGMDVDRKSIIQDEDGITYAIGPHPSRLLMDYADILDDIDEMEAGPGLTGTHSADESFETSLSTSLRREAFEIGPKNPIDPEDKKESSKIIMKEHAYDIMRFSEKYQSIRATMPFFLALLADDTEMNVDDFMSLHLEPKPEDSETERHRKGCFADYLWEECATFAHNCPVEMRQNYLISYLEDNGHEFTDEQKKMFSESNLGVNTKWNTRKWSAAERLSELQDEEGDEHPLLSARSEGKDKDVEGLNLIRVYIDKVYGEGSPDAEDLQEQVDHFFKMHADLTGSSGNWGQPIEESLDRVSGKTPPEPTRGFRDNGSRVENPWDENHTQQVRDAGHYQVGQRVNPFWFIDMLRADTYATRDIGFRARKTRGQKDIARRSRRARFTLGLHKWFGENSDAVKKPRVAIGIHNFTNKITPVIQSLVRDLEVHGVLPEHRSHLSEFKPCECGSVSFIHNKKHDYKKCRDCGDKQFLSFDKWGPEDILKEFSRLLYLKGRWDDSSEGAPVPGTEYQEYGNDIQTRGIGGVIGDNTGLEDLQNNKVGIWRNRLHSANGPRQYMNMGREAVILPMRVAHPPSGKWLVPEGEAGLKVPSLPTTVNDQGQYEENVEGTSYNKNIGTVTIPVDPALLRGAFGVDWVEGGGSGNMGGTTAVSGSGRLLRTLDVLTNVDLLLKDEDRDKGKPLPIKAMHRIFNLDDLEHLRGFSGDWVATSWPSGSRLIVKRKGSRISARNGEGKEEKLPNEIRVGLRDSHDKDFLIDAIWDSNDLHIVDILECDDIELDNKPTRDRIRHLRANFQSSERVFTPAPINTKRVDSVGLERAVKDLMKEKFTKQVLLRDADSTYMRGEMRHPKWVVYNPEKQVDVLVISSDGDRHLLGIGPLYEDDGKLLGNRGSQYDGEYYMDVGNITHSKLEEGGYATLKVAGVSRSVRNGLLLYRLIAPRYHKDSETKATDSMETLEILCGKGERNIPHHVRVKKGSIHIEVPSGHVVYDTESDGHSFLLKEVDAPDDYTLRVVESQMEYWGPLAAVLLRSEKEGKKEKIEEEPPANHDKKPKKVLPQKEILLKDPEMVKSVVIALEMIDDVLKEKWTSTGPKALGIDYGTPVESPSGPTDITEPYDMPDHDPAHRQGKGGDCWCGAMKGEECKQGTGHKMKNCPEAHPPRKKKNIKHLKISQDSHKNSSE